MAAFRGWDAAVLRAIGAPLTRENLRALDAWQQAEGGGASFNPLNTTQPDSGAGSYNSVGVRNYQDAAQGIHDTAKTLENGHYGNIIGLLRSGKATATQIATAVSKSPWGTGGGVLRVLGSGPVATPDYGAAPAHSAAQAAPAAPPASAGLSDQAFRSMAAAEMLAQSAATAAGMAPDSSGLISLALARRQLATAQPSAPEPRPVAPGAQPTPSSASGTSLPFVGSYGQEDPRFLKTLQAAASAAGATKIKVTSGERSPAHNAAVGGATHSNHLPDAQGFGHAMDGYGFVPGKGWIPLGQLLKNVATRYGLRSGATFQWGGHPDVVHVDDGLNQR